LYGLLLKPRMYAMETRRGGPFEPSMMARLRRAVQAQEYAKVARRRQESLVECVHEFQLLCEGCVDFNGNGQNNSIDERGVVKGESSNVLCR
jgi:hypothetical protein